MNDQKAHASLPRRRDQVAASGNRHGDDRFLELEFGSAVAEAGDGGQGGSPRSAAGTAADSSGVPAKVDIPPQMAESPHGLKKEHPWGDSAIRGNIESDQASRKGDVRPVPLIKGVIPANRIEREDVSAGWKLDAVAGRLVEISSPANTCALSICGSLILEAQWRNEPAAWIAVRPSLFFPPDFAARGIDLKALPIVRVTEAAKAARIADTMLRSGGFGVLVMDLGDAGQLPLPMQTRLAGLAKKHHTALICITETRCSVPTLGPLVSLRGEAAKVRAGFDRFRCELRALKDKRQSETWKHTEVCRGPGGLC